MKSAKFAKRFIAITLGAAMLLSTANINTLAADKKEKTKESAQSEYTYFKANLFDYNRDTVNKANLSLAAEAMRKDGYNGYDKRVNDSVIAKYPTLLFTSGGSVGSMAATVAGYDTIYDYKYTSFKYNANNSGRGNDVNTVGGTTYQGIVKNQLKDGRPEFNVYTTDLFNANDYSYKTIYKDVDVEFTNEGDYFVLDSDKYLYLYNNNKKIVESNKNSNHGFWVMGYNNGNYNDHFGMNLSVDFLMPEDGRYNDADCVFEFSGDDDVWVFIDGKLTLDLGGIHSRSAGKIDFANQQVVYENDRYFSDGDRLVNKVSKVSFKDLGLDVCDNEEHTLNVFYLERGSIESNCKIKFNMPTINTTIKGDVQFQKQDSSTKKPLANAEFTLFEDEKCTKAIDKVTTGKDGIVTFKELQTGVYYMKETKVPDYYTASDVDVYRVTVAGNSADSLMCIIQDNKTGAIINNTTKVDGKVLNVIYNTPIGNDVTVDKKTKLINWTDRTYNITLNASATKQVTEVTEETVCSPVDVVLVLDGSRSMYFPSDLAAASNIERNGLDSRKNYYFVTQDASATVYKVYNKNNEWYYYDSSLDHVGGNTTGTKLVVEKEYNKYVYKYGRSNTVIGQFYTSASNGNSTRFTELKNSAVSFVDSLAKMSDVSKVGIVWFNGEAGTLLGGNVVQLNNGGLATVKNAINNELEKILNSKTNQALGMKLGKEMIESIKDDNDKYLVLLTDGCPTEDYNTTYNAINGENGYATTLKANGTKIVSIGIDVNEAYMGTAVNLLKGTASNVGDTEEKYCYIADSADLDDIFGELSKLIRVENSKTKVLGGKVIDIIDARFELTTEDQESLKDATITKNSDGTTTIVWNVEALNGWMRSFDIKAKDNYVGGNDITTNGAGSGVEVEAEFYPFDQPKVNVRINLEAGVAEDEIFLGQTLEKYFTDSQLAKVFTKDNKDYQDVTLTYYWYENNAMKTGSLKDFQRYIKTLAPEHKTTYELIVKATPKVADNSSKAANAGKSMMNEDGVVYTASMRDANSKNVDCVTVKGYYIVTVVDGSLTIEKEFDHEFLTGLGYTKAEVEAIDAKQTAVFRVNRYAEGTTPEDIASGKAKVLDTCQLTITGNGSKTVVGLRAGVYQVVEGKWSWKYNVSGVNETVDDTVSYNRNDGIFYIGKLTPNAKAVTSNTVQIKNDMDKELSKIYSDTTNVLNIFVK